MTDKITLELTLDELKTLDKHIEYNEETKSVFDKIKYAYPQLKMTLENEGEYAVVSYNDTTYYRLEDSTCFCWYKRRGVSANHPIPTLVMVTDAETERLLEGLYYNHIQVKKEKEQQTKSPVEEAYKNWWGEYPGTEIWTDYDETRWVGFKAGYEFAYAISTAKEVMEKVQEEPKPFMTNCVITGNPPDGYVTWNEWYNELGSKGILHNLRISSKNYEPTPQTPEQVADGLKEAFREAVKQGVIPPVEKKQKTLTDLIERWWCDVFTTHSDWDMETSIDDLVDRIQLWLPKEQSAKGSQNAYVECSVDGFNDCLNKIKDNLR